MTRSETRCGQCGSLIPDESPSALAAERLACPACGSTSRAHSLEASVTVRVTATAQLDVVTYPSALLSTSRSLIDAGQYGIGVVVAHMACEVAAERCLTTAFTAKGVQYLEDAITDMMNGYNLGNDRNRTFYTALTGDAIETLWFWRDFKESAARRNKVIHRGAIVGQAEAEASYNAAAALVAHFKQ